MDAHINNYVDNHTLEMVSSLSKLVSIQSVRSEPFLGFPYGENCGIALDTMLEMGRNFGFTCENHGNRMGTIDFYPDKDPTLGILCHLDVVPAGDGWKNPPFTLCMSGGKLYGRGTSDDKGPAVCVLYAMKAIKDCGIKLSKNVRFLVGTDEECGSSDLAWYKENNKLPPNVFTPDGSYPVINIEKGMIRGEFSAKCARNGEKSILSANGGTVVNAVPDKATAVVVGFDEDELSEIANELDFSDMFTFEKNEEKTFIYATGKSAHASTPYDGKNAITAICQLLGKLQTSDGSGKLFSEVSSLFPYGETDGKSLKIACVDAKSGVLTEVLSILDFDGEELRGKFDIRFPLCTKCSKLQAKLEKTFESKNLLLSSFSGVEPHEVDSNSEFIKTLISVYEQATGARGSCIAIGGGTYVHDVEGGVAFGAEFPGDDSHIHSANEYISIERLKQNTKIIAEAIIRLCK